ncbi:hypothetical protein LVD15_11865 [Fulvivirga maritima]|uniref:hypothetical protein n=1 Tax=Fulvivirga maritima TaxID=2904247 RepID=UPI001F382904|nr:hypothetical protein [Fulvivirga maritima]UII29092.1 hypothetical protein LVD15_11865 [Fulvivirga maritima]
MNLLTLLLNNSFDTMMISFQSGILIIIGHMMDFTNIAFSSICKYIISLVFMTYFLKNGSQYHWTQWELNWKKCLYNIVFSDNLKKILRWLNMAYTYHVFCLAFLNIMIVFTPRYEGMHYFEMINSHNLIYAITSMCTAFVLVGLFKAPQYKALGIIKSYKDFNYKMILWM